MPPTPHSSVSLGHIPAKPYSGHVHRSRTWPTPIEKDREKQRDRPATQRTASVELAFECPFSPLCV